MRWWCWGREGVWYSVAQYRRCAFKAPGPSSHGAKWSSGVVLAGSEPRDQLWQRRTEWRSAESHERCVSAVSSCRLFLLPLLAMRPTPAAVTWATMFATTAPSSERRSVVLDVAASSGSLAGFVVPLWEPFMGFILSGWTTHGAPLLPLKRVYRGNIQYTDKK
ncbi:unnamed protein product [Lota lota]